MSKLLGNETFYSDLDGTLLNSDAKLSKRSFRLLNKWLHQGLPFSVASARNLDSISEMMRGLPISLPVVSLNGAYISDLKLKKHIQINDLGRAVKLGIVEYIREHKLGTFISNHYLNQDGIIFFGLQNKGEFWYLNDRIKFPNQLIEEAKVLKFHQDQKITCFTFINRKEKLLRLKEFILSEFYSQVNLHLFENQYSPGWYWLTIHDKLATKSKAIEFILNYLGKNNQSLTVFGDGTNDLEMFELAKTSIAVGNAKPAVKERADLIIGHHHKDSVVTYLEALINDRMSALN